MKFRLSFKTPDVLDCALQEHMDSHCESHEEHDSHCRECCSLEDAACDTVSEIKNTAEKFIEYGEYITIEFDTEAKTAVVIPLK